MLPDDNASGSTTGLPVENDQELAKQTISDQAKHILSDGYALVTLFKDVSESLGKYHFESPDALWKKDKDAMKRLIACGYEHGESLVDRQLTPHNAADFNSETSDDPELDEMMGRLFMKSRQAAQGETWGSVVAGQLEGFEALARYATGKETTI